MQDKIKSIIITGVIILVLLIPIAIQIINNNKVDEKTVNYFLDNISSTDFSLVYFGSTAKDEYQPYKKQLLEIKKTYNIPIYTVDINEITADQRKKLINLNSEFKNQNIYTVVRDGEVIYANSNLMTKEDLEKIVNKYYNNIIDDQEVSYTTITTYKDLMKIVNNKETKMIVFGRNSCSWCNRFKVIYNEVAKDNNINIYYVDSDNTKSTEYSKMLESGLIIPASCTKTKVEQPLSSGFGTPLTLYTKNGKSIDCISGYVNKTKLTEKLKNLKVI